MNSPLFQDVTTRITIRNEIYRQFCLDAKRISISIDGIYDPALSEKCLYTWMLNVFENEKKGLWLAYWCTQTSLADSYRQKVHSLNGCTGIDSESSTAVAFSYHLVDDGRQRVHINLYDDTHCDTHCDTADLCLYKPFRVCYLHPDQDVPITLYYLHLQILLDTKSLGKYEVNWLSYATYTPLDIHTKKRKNTTDADWFIVS